MPLSKVERDVLEVICEEHRQTHRGAKSMIVHVGMNAKTGEQKARIVEVLHALEKRGLLVARESTWLPTLSGKGALAEGAVDANQDEAPTAVETTAQPAPPSPLPFEVWAASIERSGAPLPDDLLNRCAVMNSTLLALAEQAAADGYYEAWRDMAWLIDTGKQLVALRGDS
ncbi:hypothetical protein [Vreelandella glaciei]|uniref:hypothetical protein n=1 Tax=Vreelandella glaciei TaxID=186761 RepID=UPI0030021E37